MLELQDMYQVGANEKVKELEAELKHDLTELHTELEEVDLPAKMTSSVPIPEGKEHFKQERRQVIKRALQVSEARPVRIQAEEMRLEMDSSQELEYTESSLPMLVHQYFTERTQQLILLKHQHMLRWKRFCEHTSTIESLYPIYNQRLTNLLNEYKDCVQRAQRLAVCREAVMLNRPASSLQAVNMEDMLIYLRWMVCHLQSTKRFNQFLKILQWFPVTHKKEICPPDVNGDDNEEENYTSKIASRYQDDIFGPSAPGSSRPVSGRSGHRLVSPIPTPPPINPALLSTAPLPASAMLYAAAAAGGGLASDEHLLNLPVHTMEFDSFRPQLMFLINVYGINFDLSAVQNSADEMEMFGAINRKFKHIFVKQEHLNSFKTYDRVEAGQEGPSSESPTHTLRKDANWCEFISLRPEKDAEQEKMWTLLQQDKKIDEILRVQAHFIKVGSADKVQDTLKEHATAVRHPPSVNSASVASHRTPHNTSVTWRKIYSNPDLYTGPEKEEAVAIPDIDERDVENVQFKNTSRAGSAKRKDSYDYVSTVQMLGLDDGEQDKADPVTAQGAYLSYLHLRHLRIRDLQRTCLSVLNYFCSIERTLTINDMGLMAEGDSLKHSSYQNHRVGTDLDGTTGGGGGLGNHGYIHNTPIDFKMSESEFIQFSEAENHDDFYNIEEGRLHVLDQKGYYIMYDKAMDDLRSLEENLLLIASHFIEKDRDLRTAGRMKSSNSDRSHAAGDFHIPGYAHQDIDRFAILLDIWTNQAAFLECKRELLDCYFEAYQHICDRDERRRMAQVITNIVNQMPRFDLSAEYFVKMYRAECGLLRHQTALVKSVLDKQIETQREYTQRVTREGDKDFGLPKRIVPRQPIAVNLSRPALKNVYMLEFHPTLAIASRIPTALKHAYWDLFEIHRPETAYACLMMEKKLLQAALKEWDSLPILGTSYSMQVQKDLFSDVFAEDPLFQCELALHTVNQQEQKAGRRTHKEKHKAMVETIARLMETLTLRHRLIDTSWETEILSKLYKKQAADMGYPDCHMNLRFVQFEFASFKDKAGKAPPIFITAVQEDESAVDKYTPSCLHLAIHELDEGHVGRFSFRSRDGVLQVLRPGGMESFQVVLKTQVLHKNALISAVQQASVCHPVKIAEWKSGRASPTETKSEKSSMTQMTGMSVTSGTALAGKLNDPVRARKAPEAFFSLQMEKTPSRDLMLNDFVTKKQQMGNILKNPEELEKVKRKLLSEFCSRFHQRLSQTSMRGQLLSYYASILNLLADFPNLRETYFVMGEPNEKKTAEDDVEGLTPDPRMLKKRPRRLLSADGSHVLNVWFIPHHTEALVMFKTLDDEACARAMTVALGIVALLHDMLQYLCTHARLGSSHARMGSQKMEFVSADWGGTEGVGSELREIQKQINNLLDPTDPQSVLELMTLRRDVMFLEFDTAVRNSMSDTFLSTGNIQAYQSIVYNAHFGLSALSNVQRASLSATYLTIPEPLEARDSLAKQILPWRSFLGVCGPFPCGFDQWFRMEHFISLCLAGLRNVDKHVANGEILGVTLLMEDVLQTGFMGANFAADWDSQSVCSSESRAEPIGSSSQTNTARSQSISSDLKEASKALVVSSQSRSLSRTLQPLESYRLLRFFLLLWKCLDVVKMDWGRRKLNVEKINSSHLYREFGKTYRTEILLPVLQSVARRLGQGDLYDSLILDTDVYVMPKGASEIEVRVKQLLRLLESLECHMITELRKRVSKELTLAVAERAREEEALPTDLWKRAVMKESFTMNRPHIAEKFVDQLMSDCQEGEKEVTFSSDHLQTCLAELARSVMAREKNNFDSYSMYYENLLRVHHQLLYTKEQEIKHMKEQHRLAHSDTQVMVQCQMANEAHDLLMEITALRAKVAEMREMSLTQERDIRERVREEYNDLIQNIFNSAFQLRSKFDEFRNDLQDDVFDKIAETRSEAVNAMGKLQQKFKGTTDEEDLKANLSRAEQIRQLQSENHHLNQLILKMKAMNSWRQNVKTNSFLKATSNLRKKAEGSKKDHLEVSMLAEEEVILLRQQLVAIRKALTSTEKESNQVRKVLQKELKMKSEREHEEAQRERSKQQLEQAKQASVDRLVDELTTKESRLRALEDEQDRTSKLTLINQDKIRKDVDTIRRQLTHERSLKLDAFQRVDDLQTQVYDYESCILNRAPSALPPSSSTSMTRMRAASAGMSRRSRPSSGGAPANWPPAVTWPANRSMTPLNGEFPQDMNIPVNTETKKIQRPKTVGGRLRSRIAEQLLNELEPETHRTIVQLEQLQLEASSGRREKY